MIRTVEIMSDVTIFAPSPTLTITIEDHPPDGEIHVHAGGQGVWQARMLMRLGASVTICAALTGETGRVLGHLLEDEGIAMACVSRPGRGSAYVHDRRGGERREIAEVEGDPLSRHELDELYGMALREGLSAGLVILSGPAGESVIPPDTYRRLASDLRAAGARVIVDLAGQRRQAALDGGVDVLKLSSEELHADGLATDGSVVAIMAAMRGLRAAGADVVVVTRGADPALLLDGDGFVDITVPQLQVADARGAGDSLTAGMAAALAGGADIREAVVTGAAAGALNITRHGLGTGQADAIEHLREAVELRDVGEDGSADQVTGRISPDGLAALAEPENPA